MSLSLKLSDPDRPSLFGPALRGLWRHRAELGWALDVLRYGICADCGLGTHGLRDRLLGGSYYCSAQLEGLSRWTAGVLDPELLHDVDALSEMDAGALRRLGRLGQPMIRRGGSRGFQTLSWDDAIKLAGSRLGDPNSETRLRYDPSELSNEALGCLSELLRACPRGSVDLPMSDQKYRTWTALESSLAAGAERAELSDLLVFGGDAQRVLIDAGPDELATEALLRAYLRPRTGGRRLEKARAQSAGQDKRIRVVGPSMGGSLLQAVEEGDWLLPVGWPRGSQAAADFGLFDQATNGTPGGDVPDHLAVFGGADAEPVSGLRLHLLLDLNPSALLKPGEAVLLLPMQSRFELVGGGTCTAIDGRVHFSPEIRGHQSGLARPDWQVIAEITERLDPERCAPADGDAVRGWIAERYPIYGPIAELFAAGDSFLPERG